MIELNYAPTGCMLLQRSFDKLIKAYPNKTIYQESVVDGKMTVKPNLYNFFDTHYDEKDKRYYGEDFAFSKLWRDIGGKCYALITEYITHVGEYQYTGRLIDEMIPVGLATREKQLNYRYKYLEIRMAFPVMAAVIGAGLDSLHKSFRRLK